LWWVPAGTVHPHCRGTFINIGGAKRGDDPDFAKVIKEILRKK